MHTNAARGHGAVKKASAAFIILYGTKYATEAVATSLDEL